MIIMSNKKEEELTCKIKFSVQSLHSFLKKKVKEHQSLDVRSTNHDNLVDKGPSPAKT